MNAGNYAEFYSSQLSEYLDPPELRINFNFRIILF